MTRLTSFSDADFLEAVGSPIESFAHRCHEASLALVQSGVFDHLGQSRVARGTYPRVWSQHSWVVIGGSPYDLGLQIVDPTLWSYLSPDQEPGERTVLTETWLKHVPHGSEYIGDVRPLAGTGRVIDLDTTGMSRNALAFLEMMGPLDFTGWMRLFNGPMRGWPSEEIVEAGYHNTSIRPTIPIDIVGMLTDINPSGLYLRVSE